MKIFTKLLPLIAAFALWACSKPSPDSTNTPPNPPPVPTAPYLRANLSQLTVSGNAGKLDSFLIESNTKWRITVVSNSTDWVTVTPLSGSGNGKVYVSSKENNTAAVARTAIALINSENNTTANVRIALTQGPYVEEEPANQPWNRLWSQLYGGSGNDRGMYAAAAPDGGLVVAGHTNSTNGDIPANNGDQDGVLLKLSATGAKQWVKTVGGTGKEELYGVTTTPDGGYLACGTSQSAELPGSGTAYLVRLDANGNLLWHKRISTSGQDAAMALTPAHDGGFLLTGKTLGQDVWIAKIDDSGNVLWEKKYGGQNEDIGYAVVKNPGGGYVIAATSQSNNGDVVGAHGRRDAWVLKVDNAGNIEWKKTIGGSQEEEIWDLKLVPDGLVLAGYTHSTDGDVSGTRAVNENGWLVKLDAGGNLRWQKYLRMAIGASVAVSPDNQHYFLAGANAVAQVDHQGNLVAQQVFSTVNSTVSTLFYHILPVSATEYMVTGYTSKADGAFSANKGGEDIWVVKFKLP